MRLQGFGSEKPYLNCTLLVILSTGAASLPLAVLAGLESAESQ